MAKKVSKKVTPVKKEVVESASNITVTVKVVAVQPGQFRGSHVAEGTEFTWTGALNKGRLPLWVSPLEKFEVPKEKKAPVAPVGPDAPVVPVAGADSAIV